MWISCRFRMLLVPRRCCFPDQVEPGAIGDDSGRSMTCLSPATHLRDRQYEQA
jgi:hypothetical protein